MLWYPTFGNRLLFLTSLPTLDFIEFQAYTTCWKFLLNHHHRHIQPEICLIIALFESKSRSIAPHSTCSASASNPNRIEFISVIRDCCSVIWLSKALEFAVSEWILMFLLSIDACFTYLIAKFASYCQLQGPCVLCSRCDHVLATDKTGIYWDSICNHHKSEISSLVLCHVHGICENCLLSFANKPENKFSDETIRLLVGKVGSSPLQNCYSSDSRICFCCNEQYVSRGYVENLLPNSSIRIHASESLFVNGEHAKNEKNIFVDDSLESLKSSHIGKNQIAHSSENDLEILVSDIAPEVHLKSDPQFEVHDLHNDPATIVMRDTDEIKWQNDENKEELSQMTEQMSFDEVPSSNNAETHADACLDTKLEEERNASAVAANQAMAMITRLQEEKAALYTEALQCLRMMEEQAEYDNEALQNANDIIQEKDNQIQDLEKLLKTSEDVRE
ncbi:hypothetical protein L1987_76799 [Smallanthus sonchifolius]|uniref:Uncharacterized protein n=1 Tax=Smallanthus sonchifolius TaxID=185202 RepID=A0ACB8Z813_9ASTR|nr:hypothetical protein L1987_76799 [Smallanthus sonchifolius]